MADFILMMNSPLMKAGEHIADDRWESRETIFRHGHTRKRPGHTDHELARMRRGEMASWSLLLSAIECHNAQDQGREINIADVAVPMEREPDTTLNIWNKTWATMGDSLTKYQSPAR